MYKVGQTFYLARFDYETGKCGIDTYRIRTIRAGKVYAWIVNEFTSKNGKWIVDKIDPIWRESWSINEDHTEFKTTKLQAWRKLNKNMSDYLSGKNRMCIEKEIAEKVLNTTKRFIKNRRKD